MAYFTNDQIAELIGARYQTQEKFAELRQRYLSWSYRDARAREHAVHGFARRLGTLARCVDRVFETLPPGRDDIPSREEVEDATICLQAFVVNVFGCCDNLAWIWILEKPVLREDGRPPAPREVGFQNPRVRESFSSSFREYLDSRATWFDHVKSFRDALSHRIPLYIPPFVVVPERLDRYQALQTAADEALRRRDFAGCDRATAEQEALGAFRPWMVRSLTEASPPVVFHPQLLADFNTVDEIGGKLLEELERRAGFDGETGSAAREQETQQAPGGSSFRGRTFF